LPDRRQQQGRQQLFGRGAQVGEQRDLGATGQQRRGEEAVG